MSVRHRHRRSCDRMSEKQDLTALVAAMSMTRQREDLPEKQKEKKPFSFYELLPDGRIMFFVDASLLKSFSHCERYFYLKHVKNLRQKGYGVTMPFPMAIGSWWSDVMEMFYNFLRDKREVTQQDIQDFALTAWSTCNLDACALADPDKFELFGDLAGAVLMLQEYYNSQYLVDKMNWKVVAVEEGF